MNKLWVTTLWLPLFRKTAQRSSLVVDVLSLAMDLVDQRKIKVEALDTFSMKHSDLGLELFILHVLDHIREPNSQSVVAKTKTKETKCKLSTGDLLCDHSEGFSLLCFNRTCQLGQCST